MGASKRRGLFFGVILAHSPFRQPRRFGRTLPGRWPAPATGRWGRIGVAGLCRPPAQTPMSTTAAL